MGNQLSKRNKRMRTLSSANKQLKFQYSDFRSSRKRSEKESRTPEDKQKLCLRNELLISEQPIMSSKKMRKQLSNQRVTNQMSIVAIQDVLNNQHKNIKSASKVKTKNHKSSSCSIKLFRRKFCCF